VLSDIHAAAAEIGHFHNAGVSPDHELDGRRKEHGNRPDVFVRARILRGALAEGDIGRLGVFDSEVGAAILDGVGGRLEAGTFRGLRDDIRQAVRVRRRQRLADLAPGAAADPGREYHFCRRGRLGRR
jgi:hypothetical protein